MEAAHSPTAATDRITIRLGHSPDPDDAFMWWPLFELDGKPAALDTGRFRFEQVCQDIQSLNERSRLGDLEITALSMHQYAHVAERYLLTACGASLGKAYGPKLVAREKMPLEALRNPGVTIAIPGEQTTAFLALSLLLGPGSFRTRSLSFETIIEAVASGECEAGLIIHEGQLTFAEAGLSELADMGRWWHETHGLPLPLGGNALRRDLDDLHGPGTLVGIAELLEQSIRYALEHRREGLTFALDYARDMTQTQADEFVAMYVNDYTLDVGEVGERAVRTLLQAGHAAGLTPDTGEIGFLRGPR
ncbi:MAG: menaquinone biosynthesis family protein [Phycisphaerales bacterium JB038]